VELLQCAVKHPISSCQASLSMPTFVSQQRKVGKIYTPSFWKDKLITGFLRLLKKHEITASHFSTFGRK